MRNKSVLSLGDLKDAAAGSLLPRIGGKALHLLELQQEGHPVPRWLAVDSHAFTEFVGEVLRTEFSALLTYVAEGGRDAVFQQAEKIRALIADASLPAALAAEVKSSWISDVPDLYLAVRSSAVDEDSAGQSFAGLHDSFLFVRGEAQLTRAILGVWGSAFSERALLYRLERGISLAQLRIAVLVQEMIEPVASGVLFTAHPNNGDPQIMVASSLWGLGEGLVSEGLDADTFVIHKDSFEIEATVIEKNEQFVLDRVQGSGTSRITVEPERRQLPSLTDQQLHLLAQTGIVIEKQFFRPQDIEFAIDRAGALHILQTRDITTAPEYGPAAGHMLLWDNSNIIESYSGVTSPLTFSFIKRAYTIVYHCFASVMGVPPSVVRQNQQVFSNMLGLFHGQVYYNLLNWYRLIRLFPGYSLTKQYMESMMGVSESLTGTISPSHGVRNSKVRAAADLLRLLLQSLWKFICIRRITREFAEHFDLHYRRWDALAFDALPPHELMETYYEMEDRLLWNWKAPIINDFFVMIFYGTLKKLCSSWCGDTAGTLQNSLLAGEGGIESTEPTKMLIRLAGMANQDPLLKKLLEEEQPEALPRLIAETPEAAEFYALYTEYLSRYGFRCMNELKLEEFSLRDKPGRVFEHLKNYLGVDPLLLDLQAMEAREQKVRRDAEERVETLLSAQHFPALRKTLFRWVLSCARLGVKNRENMRFARTKIYGLLRELFRAVGMRFAEEGILKESQDIFYLTVEEIWDYIRGTAVTTDLGALTALRKAEFDRYRKHPEETPDNRFTTWGIAYHKNRFRARTAPQPAPDGSLRGTGCCAGVITGPVKVIRDPGEGISLKGEILVAGRTDPGWVPLYPAATGILIERGSILSHSAIVAREMGIPTIVGIPHLLEKLRTGDIVTMDGATGEITIVAEQPPANGEADRPSPPPDYSSHDEAPS